MAKFSKSAYTSVSNPSRDSNLLSKRFVYYEVLKDNPNPRAQALYENVSRYIGNGGTITRSFSDKSGIANLRNLASKERGKEIQLIKQNLNITLPEDFWRDSGQFHEALNTLMETKEVYQRNRERILGKDLSGQRSKGNGVQAKIDISSFFITYFNGCWKDIFQSKNDSDVQNLIHAAATNNMSQALYSVNNITEKCFNMAIEKMIKSATTNKSSDDRRAYEEMLNSISKLQKQGIYGREMAEAFKLDAFSSKMADYFIEQGNAQYSEASLKKARSALTGSALSAGSKTGNFSEIWAQAVINELSNLKTINESVNVWAERIGQMEGKTDLMISFGTDLGPVLQILEENSGEGSGQINRTKFIQTWDKIGQELLRASEGFLVLTNNKNYTIGKAGEYNFEDVGFSGGRGGNLEDLEEILKRAQYLSEGDINATIFTIMNTAAGAIGEDLKPDMELKLSEDIAYFLFDDINMIGKEYTTETANVLHLLYLDGIYIPLSSLLELLADALEQTLDEAVRYPTNYVQVEYDIPEIKYELGGEEGLNIWTAQDWINQKNETLENTRFSVHFLKNFRETIRKLTT